MAATQRITTLEDVPAESTFLFRVADELGDQQEAILVATEDGDVACWLNYCQHFTHIKLDKGDGAPMRDGEVICANHGAYFEAGSGECTFGPCEGAYLSALEVTVSDGSVYLTDDEYEFVGPGPIDDGDDLTSTSNVEF
ncbi:Rieske (2Fe-2S) protein [Natronococcus occultus]|uniref:Ferredoxin subunit of nitrite reductase and ring-hydroxylating dioxygenase n=1 Tax=Natronococcus occultus SP4 TaxID=694430 RepID=L0JWQ8_9EURY|nr:Rieske 2Fe-2S domain-containing protein [Natronococcus occultus]AGB36544.1 ferredoxin subunit of nitrite reductase and ring-hydroxylating dioxygenase [Natronococcus occultus SP4]